MSDLRSPTTTTPRRRKPRDLPPRGGPVARLQLWAGDAAIRAVELMRPPLTLGVRLAAFDAEGRVFLVRHSYLPGWHLPGGGVEAAETAREAVVREAREEGGLVFDTAPTMFHFYAHATTGRRDHVALFTVRGARQASVPRGLEIRDSAFFAPDALPAGATPATRARIAEVLGTAVPGDRW